MVGFPKVRSILSALPKFYKKEHLSKVSMKSQWNPTSGSVLLTSAWHLLHPCLQSSHHVDLVELCLSCGQFHWDMSRIDRHPLIQKMATRESRSRRYSAQLCKYSAPKELHLELTMMAVIWIWRRTPSWRAYVLQETYTNCKIHPHEGHYGQARILSYKVLQTISPALSYCKQPRELWSVVPDVM